MAGGNPSKSNMTKYKKSYSKQAAQKASAKNASVKKGTKQDVKQNKTRKDVKALQQPEEQQLREKKGLSLAAAIVIGAVAAFILELSLFNVFGQIGGWLKYVQFGLFGSMAYLFPIGVLLLFIGFSSKVKQKKKLVLGAVLFIFLCSFLHLLSSHSLNNRNILSYFKNCADSRSGGGIIGGAIALGLYLMLSQTGAVIINILVILLCLFFLFEDQIKALFSYIFSGSSEDAYDDYEYEDYDDEPEYPENRRHKKSRRSKEEQTLLPDDPRARFDAGTERSRFEREPAGRADTRVRRGRSDQSREEPVFITEDEDYTVIRLVKSKNRSARKHSTELVRINRKAKPMRDGSRVSQRSEHKVKGVSDQLEMLPHNAGGDEVHEITARSAARRTSPEPRRMPEQQQGSLSAQHKRTYPGLAGTDIRMSSTEPDAVTPVHNDLSSDATEEDVFDRSEARVTKVAQAAVNRRAKQERPVKVRKGDDQIPGQQEINREELGIRTVPEYGKDLVYYAPPMNLLDRVKTNGRSSEAELEKIARNLEDILARFSVNVTVTDIQAGPSVTRFELAPELGTRVGKITALADDLKLNLGVTEIRIEAPIPGRQAVGIEIPNKNRQTVYMRELLEEPALINHPSKIAFAAGKDISGNVIVADIAKMPHLLVAGTTGSGKSVFLNTILMTILFRADPSEVGLIIIDPKQVEFGIYAGIPHLMKDVVTDPGQAVSTLRWAVNEMSNRYQRMKLSSVRDFKAYNAKVEKGQTNPEEENPRKMNQIVIIIDELADLMMVAKKEAESLICRLAQLARAAGIHLIIATQRPSVDVVTGLIKANVPARVALLVSSQIDSRTIIDMPGAEKLLGYGDMLFYPTGYVKPVRIQGAFVSDDEVQKTVDYLIANNRTDYFSAESDEIEKFMSSGHEDGHGADGQDSQDDAGKYDECFYEAGKMCIEMGKASSSMLQRRFSIGFNRAARVIEQLEEFGVVGPQNGAKPRQILVDVATFEQMYSEMTGG